MSNIRAFPIRDAIQDAVSRFDLTSAEIIDGACYFSKAARAWVIRRAIDNGATFSAVARVLKRHRTTVRETYLRVTANEL